MKLWTTQPVAFYEELMEKGINYCKQVSQMAEDYHVAYQWMVEQMLERIGEPPLPDIKQPIWAWYQYTCKKKRKPTLSSLNKTNPEEREVLMELEMPDCVVLLSDFDLWHYPLNHWFLGADRKLDKLCEPYYGHTEFDKRPSEVQRVIMDSWVKIFDLNHRNRYYASKARKNRSIQATLWLVKKEYVVSAVEY